MLPLACGSYAVREEEDEDEELEDVVIYSRTGLGVAWEDVASKLPRLPLGRDGKNQYVQPRVGYTPVLHSTIEHKTEKERERVG